MKEGVDVRIQITLELDNQDMGEHNKNATAKDFIDFFTGFFSDKKGHKVIEVKEIKNETKRRTN